MRVLMAIVTAAAAAVFISGCEKIWGGDGYTWSKRGPPAAAYTWVQLAQPDLELSCGHVPGTNPGLRGCAFYDYAGGQCVVLSRWIEIDARKQLMNGRSHFEHEAGPLKPDGSLDGEKGFGHCAGYMHAESHVRGV